MSSDSEAGEQEKVKAFLGWGWGLADGLSIEQQVGGRPGSAVGPAGAAFALGSEPPAQSPH